MASREEVGIDVTARDMASNELDKVGGAVQRIEGAADAAAGGTSRFGNAFRSMAQGVLMGVGQQAFMMAQQAITQFVGGSIQAASDLDEARTKAEVVFGSMLGHVEEFASGSAEALGISETAALGAAGTYAAMFKAMGMGLEPAAELSTKIVTLGSDLGSFNNIEPDIMLEKLRAALTGEFEPMKALGVVLNEATIKTKAFEMGLYSGTGALDAQTKAQVVYAEIVRQTADAQGDFARTSDGYANQSRINAAKMQESMIGLGRALMPIAATVMPMLTTAVQIASGALTILVNNAPAIGIALAVVAGVLWTTVVPAFVAWAAATIAATWPILAIGAAIAAFVLAVDSNFLFLGDIVNGTFGLIEDVVSGIIEFVLNAAEVAVGIAASIPGPWQEGAKEVQATLQQMKADVEAWGEDTTRAAGNATAGWAAALTGGAEAADAAAADLVDGLPAATTAAKDEAARIAGMTPEAMAGSMLEGLDDLDAAMAELADTVVNSVSDAEERAAIEAALASQGIRDGLNSESTRTRLDTIALVEDLLAKYEMLAPGAIESGRLVNPALTEGLNENLHMVVDAAEEIARQTRTPLELGSLATTWGANVTRGFASGMWQYYDAIRQASLAAGAAASAGLRVESPAPEGELAVDHSLWGENLVAGMIAGMVRTAGRMREASLTVATAAASAIGGTAPGLAIAGATAGLGAVGAPAGGLSIVNHFGRDSVRSEDDIREIDRRLALQLRMEGT